MASFINKLFAQLSDSNTRNALFINNGFIQYGELASRVFGITKHMNTLKHDGPIGVLSSYDVDCYACIIASWLSGKGFVALHPNDPISVHQNVINKLSVKSIYRASENIPITYDLQERIFNLNEISNADSDSWDINDANTAYVIFSSGSTAEPKEIRVSQKNLNAFVQAFNSSEITLSQTDRVLHVSDFTFDMSMLTFLMPLIHGACIYPLKKEGVSYLEIAEMMQEHEISFTAIVPSTLRFLRPHMDEIYFPSLSNCLVCGEAFPIDLAAAWQTCAPNATIFNIYGPTEATVFVLSHVFRLEHQEEQFNGIMSLGKPLENTEIIILDDSMKETSNNQMGELCIAGPQVTEQKDDFVFIQLTDEQATTRYYRTGDLAFEGKNGLYYYGGRKDFMIQVKGHRVQPLEIEQQINKHFPNVECCIVPTKDSFQNTSLILFAVGNSEEVDAMWEMLPQFLKHYELPDHYRLLDNMPLNKNQKMDRKRLQDWADESE